MKRLLKMLAVFLLGTCLLPGACLPNPWNLVYIPPTAPGGVSFVPNLPFAPREANPASILVPPLPTLLPTLPARPTPILDRICPLFGRGPLRPRACP